MSTAVVAKEGEINGCAELEDVESGIIYWNLSWLPAASDKSCLQTGTYISKMCNNEISRVVLSLIKVRSIYLSLIKLYIQDCKSVVLKQFQKHFSNAFSTNLLSIWANVCQNSP